jgi:hypothetical protein
VRKEGRESLFEEGEGVVVLVLFVEGPDILLVQLYDGYFAALRDVDEDGVQLCGVGVLALPLLLVVHVHLFLR